jgi:hypothetical protein
MATVGRGGQFSTGWNRCRKRQPRKVKNSRKIRRNRANEAEMDASVGEMSIFEIFDKGAI